MTEDVAEENAIMEDSTNGLTRRRAAGYVRVSTEDQAKHGASMPSQIAALEKWCKANDAYLVRVFEEPGISGTDENRPQFRALMAAATSKSRPFDVVLVFSLSRFARDLATQVVSVKQLDQARVELVSTSEPFGRDAAGGLMRSIVGAFNQHLSDESSKNTRRTMNQNAHAGFWNGGPVPFGYRSATVEMRQDKAKKKLELVPDEAALVALMFDLAEHGSGNGPMGARAIADQLNGQGHSLRGGRFYNGNVAGILAREHYCGFYFDAKVDEHGHPLSTDQWARVPCPAIVGEEQFASVAARRALRNPRKTAPRITTGVTMLPATIGRCGQAECGAGLTVVTGKGGQYHYYACAERVNRGAGSCDLQSLRREALDKIVLDALLERILAPEHLRELLAGLLERSDGADARRRKALAIARAGRTDAQKALTNLLILVETGALLPSDPEMAARMAHHRSRIVALDIEIKSTERQLGSSKQHITPANIAKFGEQLSNKLREGTADFRRAYVALLVERVTVANDVVHISGSKLSLEHAFASVDKDRPNKVPIFDREWCPGRDSNSRPAV